MSTQMAPAKSNLAELNDLLRKSESQIARALPKHLTPERMMRVAMTAYSKSQELQKCTAMSITGCVVQASELGLELTGPLGQAYMVPRWNKKISGLEASFQVGYRGYITLAYRSGMVKTFCAHEVYSNDEFDYSYGTKQFLHHKPAKGERGELTHFYAICLQLNGGEDFEVMTLNDIKKHAEKYVDKRNLESEYSPWKTAFVEMAKKTPLRRLAKRVPMSVELTMAAVQDEQNEMAAALVDGELITIGSDDNGQPPTNMEEVKKTTAAKAAKAKDKPSELPKETPKETPKQEAPADDVSDLVDNLVGDADESPPAPAKPRKTFNDDGIVG